MTRVFNSVRPSVRLLFWFIQYKQYMRLHFYYWSYNMTRVFNSVRPYVYHSDSYNTNLIQGLHLYYRSYNMIRVSRKYILASVLIPVKLSLILKACQLYLPESTTATCWFITFIATFFVWYFYSIHLIFGLLISRIKRYKNISKAST